MLGGDDSKAIFAYSAYWGCSPIYCLCVCVCVFFFFFFNILMMIVQIVK